MSIQFISMLFITPLASLRGAHVIKAALIAMLLIGLTACGGGGGNNDPDPIPPAQPFNFAQAGPITLYTGDTFTNTANGLGTDAVSYESSDKEVAVVDATTGKVTLVGAGSAVIVANKLVNVPNSTSKLIASQAVYTINSSEAPLAFEQAGPLDIYVRDELTNNVSGPGPGVVSYKSGDTSIATVDATTGQVIAVRAGTAVITGYKLIDVPNSTSQAIVAKTTYTVNIAESGPAFSARYFHRAVEFNNQLWLINGRNSDDIKTDTWSSTDAITWTQQTIGSTFSPRAGHAAVVFNNRLWVIGGFDGTDKNDVWSSADGLAWTEETASATFPVRQAFQVVAYNNRLWLIGGQVIPAIGSATEKNDVWSSADGITWIEEAASAAFPARHYHQVTAYNNKLWLIAGQSTDANGVETEYNDVWSSTDGITWLQETANAAFSARQMPQVVVYNNLLWLIAGNDGSKNLNDVWSSSDGVNWIEQTAEAAFSKRSAHQVAVYDNRLILVGGYSNGEINDVWSSTDGVDWLVVYKGALRAP